MDENLEFKNVIAQANGGVYGENMILMPYAKNIKYNNGTLGLTLEFFNEGTETEIGLNIKLSDDLIDLIDNLLFGEE